MRLRRIFEALSRLIQRRSDQAVLILLVEDLHWFDPQSASFLERLIESYPGSRTLVLTNATGHARRLETEFSMKARR